MQNCPVQCVQVNVPCLWSRGVWKSTINSVLWGTARCLQRAGKNMCNGAVCPVMALGMALPKRYEAPCSGSGAGGTLLSHPGATTLSMVGVQP